MKFYILVAVATACAMTFFLKGAYAGGEGLKKAAQVRIERGLNSTQVQK